MLGLSLDLMALLGGHQQFVIPPYQRSYEWHCDNWQRLIRDVMNVTTRPDPPHWMGIFLRTGGIPVPNTLNKQHIVVDGQQRLVTLRLWLAALEHAAEDLKSPLPSFDYADIIVQDSDMPSYQAALNKQWKNQFWINRLDHGPIAAYGYFRWILWLGQDALLAEEPIKLPKFRKTPTSLEDGWTQYCVKKGIQKGKPANLGMLRDATLYHLNIWTLEHQPKVDESHAEIFDTLNGARIPLEPFDHVRNSLFIRITPDELAKKTFDEIWAPLEKKIRGSATKRIKSQTLFLYDYVISRGESKNQGPINSRRGAAHFAYMTQGLKDQALVDFVRDSVAPSMSCWPTILGRANDVEINGVSVTLKPETQQLLQSIRELSAGPVVPAIMFYMVNFMAGTYSEDEFCKYLRLLEAYIARWILGGRPLSPLRAKFMQILGEIDGRTDFGTLKKVLSADWIDDDIIKKLAIAGMHPYYEKAKGIRIGAILRGIESESVGKSSYWFQLGKAPGQFTVEHIFPQTSVKWETDLKLWHQPISVMKSLVHTLGNLTLVTVEHNCSVKDAAFEKKVKHPSNTPTTPLKLNDWWLGQKQWTAREIKARTEMLISLGLKHWKIN